MLIETTVCTKPLALFKHTKKTLLKNKFYFKKPICELLE